MKHQKLSLGRATRSASGVSVGKEYQVLDKSRFHSTTTRNFSVMFLWGHSGHWKHL